MKNSVKTAIIGGVCTIIAGGMGIFAGTTITNSNNLVVNVNGEEISVTPQEYEEIVEENANLKKENEELQSENENLQEQKSGADQTESTKESSTNNFMEECPPYEINAGKTLYNDTESFKMGGKNYNNGFYYGSPGPADEYYILFNTEGRYSQINFDFGHVDDTIMEDCIITVYLDGSYSQTLEKKADELVTNETIQLNYADQLKLCFETGGSGHFGTYGLANIKYTK